MGWQGYHLLAMALFSPALLLEPQLLAVSLAIAAAALMAVETLRVGGTPGLAPRIDAFMTSFLDSRDSGGVLISHFSLLAGMAVPVSLTVNGQDILMLTVRSTDACDYSE